MQEEDFISLNHGYVELQKEYDDNTDECLVYTPPIILDFQVFKNNLLIIRLLLLLVIQRTCMN